MRLFAGLGMAALMVAVTLTSGCNPGRIEELEFTTRRLMQQVETLQGNLGKTEADLTLATREANLWKANANTQANLVVSLRGQRSAELLADKATIADLQRKLAEAAAQAPGTIVLPKALDAKLKQFAAAFPNIVTYEASTGMVQYKDAGLLFELGSAKVLAGAQASLATLAEVIKSAEAAEFDIVIVGHTDTTRVIKPASVAEFKDNWGLSAFRARSVMQALKNAGVPQTKMAIMGFSMFRPIAVEKAKNRRVEIFFERANRFSPNVIQTSAPVDPGGVQVP